MENGAQQKTVSLIPAQDRPLPAILPWTRTDFAWLVGLCLATYAVYLPVLRFDFVFDDRPFILQNPWLLSWHSIPRFFSAHLVSFLHPHAEGTYYRPGLLLWLLVQRKIWNLNSVGWHFSTLTLHVLASLSVYALARQILRVRYGAGLAALVFALHPAHVESSAWIMGSPDPLMTLLAVSSIVSFIRWRQSLGRSRNVWALTSLLLYAAAILTKEVALVLPALAFVYEWIIPSAGPSTRAKNGLLSRFLQALMPTWGYWAVTAAYLVARWAALGGLSHLLTPLAWQSMAATWPLVLWMHLKLLLWPVGLSAFYDVPYVTHPGLGNFVMPLAAFLACGLFGLYLAWKSPRAAFAGVWFFLPMVLLLNLRVFPPGEIVHDRYMYFPSVGFALLVALGLQTLVASTALPFSIRARQIATVATLGLVLSAATIHYSRFWANDWVLYARALAVAPGNKMAANNLAVDLADAGRYEDAVALEQRVLARDPNYALAQYNLGYCQYRQKQYADARQNLMRAISLSPAEPEPYLYLGLTDYRMGLAAEAVVNVRHAVELIPENARYRFTLGLVLRTSGDVAAARVEFITALALDSTLAAARDQLKEIDQQPAPR